MSQNSTFETIICKPKKTSSDDDWAFVLLPKSVSEKLPRRGRTTVLVGINGHEFQVLLEPDGQKSHWFVMDENTLQKSRSAAGSKVTVEITPVEEEPDPEVPDDLLEALQACADAWKTWTETTTIARVDWIHWVVSSKQQKTRIKRINDACDMLASGKKRVCCFDPSGFYSKAFRAPEAA